MRRIAKKERIITFFVGIVLGALIGAGFHKETIVVREGIAENPAALSSVSIMIDDGDRVRTWNTVSWHEAMSILDLLDFMETTGNLSLSVDKDRTRVLSIDGIPATETPGMRWQYWVNNAYEPRIADKYYLKPGDIVVWKYARE